MSIEFGASIVVGLPGFDLSNAGIGLDKAEELELEIIHPWLDASYEYCLVGYEVDSVEYYKKLEYKLYSKQEQKFRKITGLDPTVYLATSVW